jgi:hypothetical protein
MRYCGHAKSVAADGYAQYTGNFVIDIQPIIQSHFATMVSMAQ